MFSKAAYHTQYGLTRNISSPSPGKKLVLGCGSNVVDQIFKVQAVPQTGEKGFFQSPTRILEKSVVGGVTLNHLSWASLLGVPTGLLALQGVDKPGRIIRKRLKELEINQEFVQVDKSYTTAESYVFVQQDGERSIIMASGATSHIHDHTVKKCFEEAVMNHASMLTTEISQVPLSGVIQLLTTARKATVPTVVDFDVSPEVAFKEAKLGTMDQIKQVLEMVDVLKPAKHAAHELLTLIRPDLKGNLKPADIVRYLVEMSSSKLVAMTNGSQSTFIGTREHLVEIPTERLVNVVDATGAGDAFLGGIIAGLHYHGYPNSIEKIRELGELANKAGAASCQVLGGLPEADSRVYLSSERKKYHVPEISEATQPKEVPKESSHQVSFEFEASIIRDMTAVKEIIKCLEKKTVSHVIDLLYQCKGSVLTSAIGKSGLVASRFAGSLSSIGVASHFIHVSEWAHGDLGKINPDDIVVFISHSGHTREVIKALEIVKQKNIPIIAIVGYIDSPISNMCSDTCISYIGYNDLDEPLGGIPTTSIVLQDALVNGIICELIKRKKLTRKDFLANHPGGLLGERFSKI